MAGIYKRGSVYWARAQRQGKEYRISLKTADRRTAQQRLRTWLDDLEAMAWGELVPRSFNDAAERFAAEHVRTLKPSSQKRYQVSLSWLLDHFDGKALHRITSAEMSAFETWRRGMGTTAPTVRRDLACLSSLLTACEDWEWLKEGSNPVPAFMRKRRKRGLREAPPRTRYLSEEEEVAAIAEASPLVALAIRLSIDTGLRREELFSLTWEQVDLSRGLIRTTKLTKSGKERVVPLGESARFLAQHPRRLGCPHVLWNERTGERLLQVNKGFNAACKRAEVKGVRWHDLRRTAGCRWLQRDRKSMEEVSWLLGHSSVQVTENRYAFLNEEAAALGDRRTFSGTGTAD